MRGKNNNGGSCKGTRPAGPSGCTAGIPAPGSLTRSGVAASPWWEALNYRWERDSACQGDVGQGEMLEEMPRRLWHCLSWILRACALHAVFALCNSTGANSRVSENEMEAG